MLGSESRGGRTDYDLKAAAVVSASVLNPSPIVRIGGSGGGGAVVRRVRGCRCSIDRDPGERSSRRATSRSRLPALGRRCRRTIGGREHRLFRVTCADRWRHGSLGRGRAVSVADLIPAVRDRASGMIGLPVPSVNPPPASGGIVNVGLWLAVEEQAVPSITAEAGGVWITVSPRLEATRYEFGNGDAIECEGVGVPIESVHPDLDVVEQSPSCGYTYRRSSPDGDPYALDRHRGVGVAVRIVERVGLDPADGTVGRPRLRRRRGPDRRRLQLTARHLAPNTCDLGRRSRGMCGGIDPDAWERARRQAGSRVLPRTLVRNISRRSPG